MGAGPRSHLHPKERRIGLASGTKRASLLTLLLTVALVILLYPYLQNPSALQGLLRQWGWIGVVLALFITSSQMLFPVVPFALLAGINALAFGWFAGFILSLSGSLLGSTLGFGLARALGQEWVQTKTTAKLGGWSARIDENSFFLVLLARLIPILPAAAVNYAAGLCNMKFRTFFAATLLGKIPMIAWESWFGHDLWQITQNPKRFVLALAFGILIFGTTGLLWYRKERKKLEV